MYRRKDGRISVRPSTVRTVWAALSRHPRATMRELCEATKHSQSTVQSAMVQLEELGYIERPRTRGGHQAITRETLVLVPLIGD